MKKVLVAYTDYNYLKYVRAWVHGARDIGKWDGDIVVIIPYCDKVKVEEKEFSDLDIKFFYPKEFGPNFYIHYYKLFIFDDYFKQWDWVFHVDLDVVFYSKIELGLSERNENLFYANKDGISLYQQFDYKDEPIDGDIFYAFAMTPRKIPVDVGYTKEVLKKTSSFQGCFLLLNKKLIIDGYLEELKQNYWKYAVYEKCCERLRDQVILNLTLKDIWSDLGEEFVGKIPFMEEIEWDISKLENGYYDDYDYTGKSILHMGRYLAPWDKNNLRFYPIWKEYNDRV